MQAGSSWSMPGHVKEITDKHKAILGQEMDVRIIVRTSLMGNYVN